MDVLQKVKLFGLSRCCFSDSSFRKWFRIKVSFISRGELILSSATPQISYFMIFSFLSYRICYITELNE